ncbi:putative cytochrome P450 304a1 [Cryptotermes secundus]|uniref:Putative cytochrome P450 304a1 n=2 Tax=Cryptotermes secundus TaxID=105785 RepID=A0A2J7Q2A2_9NEOP|nr:probable cytochrome P450 304a1 isoform X1 [Cryptotermes secundus]PNF22710.1 putative cytochrome P450 304a1 [Cryptotermes secundus]
MNPFLVLAVVLLLVLYIFRVATTRPPNFPPGPPSLPIYGAYWLLLLNNWTYIHKAIEKMRCRYRSNLLGFYLGGVPTVVACDYETIKEIETRPEFLGRMDTIIARERGLGKLLGVILADGPLWAHQRRYMLRHMRDFGFGTRSASLENLVQQEIQDMVDILNGKKQDKGIYRDGLALLPDLFFHILLNAIWSMYAGDRFSYTDHGHARFIAQQGIKFVRANDPTGRALALTPWIRHIFPQKSGFTQIRNTNTKLVEVIKKTIDEHIRTHSEDHMRDFIDIYIKEMKTNENNPNGSPFSEEQLIFLGWDLLVSTATTLTTTLSMYIMYMMHHPEVQSNIQNEIDTVVGHNRLPTLNDRSKMPYMEASLRELMRISSIFSLGIAHRATEDTHLRGYFIPKNTMLLTGLHSYHNDPEVWGDPHIYRPERFLDEKGQLLKKDLTLPFGAGKRLCAGETFGRQNMWLILTGLLQNFTLAVPKGQKPPDLHTVNGFHQTSPEVWFQPLPRT